MSVSLPQTLENAEYSFFVPGVPKPQGSKRAFVVKGRPVLTESAGQAHKDWRAIVAYAGAEQMGSESPLKGPVTARLTFRLPRPKSHPKTRRTWPISRPDIDKLARSILDALTHICWVDDAQIVTLELYKVWADEHRPVGCAVQIWGYTWEEK